MGTWLNGDGLFLKFGTDEGVSQADAGMYCGYGPEQVYEWDLTLSELTEAETIQNHVCVIPDDFLITEVQVQSLVTAATGVAIDVGTIHISQNASDSEYTADPNGLIAALDTASMAVGELTTFRRGSGGLFSIVAGDAFGGALIGTVTTAPTLLTASRTTSTAFTAGRVIVTVKGRPAALNV